MISVLCNSPRRPPKGLGAEGSKMIAWVSLPVHRSRSCRLIRSLLCLRRAPSLSWPSCSWRSRTGSLTIARANECPFSRCWAMRSLAKAIILWRAFSSFGRARSTSLLIADNLGLGRDQVGIMRNRRSIDRRASTVTLQLLRHMCRRSIPPIPVAASMNLIALMTGSTPSLRREMRSPGLPPLFATSFSRPTPHT